MTSTKRATTTKAVTQSKFAAPGTALAASTLQKLRKWNIVLAVVYAVQGIAILLCSVNKSLPVTTSYSAIDPLQTAAQGHSVGALSTHFLFDANLVYLVAGTLFILAIAHVLFATYYRHKYEHAVASGVHRGRWLAASLGAGLMVVTIGLLAGIQDVSVLLALFAGAITAALCASVIEAGARLATPVNKLLYLAAIMAAKIPWVVIAIYLLGSKLYAGHVAGYVYALFISMFALSVVTGAYAYLSNKAHGRWADPLYAERGYMLIGLVAASIFAWQIFAGILKP